MRHPLVLLAVAFAAMASLFIPLALLVRYATEPTAPAELPEPVECVTGIAQITSEEFPGLFVKIGETSICGRGLRFADPIVGPDYATHIAALQDELARWRACVLTGVCRDDMRKGS